MPGLTGFEVMRILKADANLRSIPIIVVTAAGDNESRSRAIELGAEDYVTKPYSVRELLLRIRAVMRRSSKPDSNEDHLEFLRGFVESKLRQQSLSTGEPLEPRNKLLVNRLPKWTKVAKNRSRVLAGVMRLEKKLRAEPAS